MRFVKMHGLGNDFVVLDQREGLIALTTEQVRLMADRRFGVGCDQLIILGPPVNSTADIFMHIYNADGSVAGMCGNAARCVIGLLGGDNMIETSGGLYDGKLEPDGSASIDMGLPKRDWAAIPMSQNMDTDHVIIPGMDLPPGVAVNVGNPHIVFFVDDVASVDLEKIGPVIENHQLFPERINVEFIQIIAPDHLQMRVWERGAGITQACGTGATASFIAARVRDLCESRAKVVMPGGTLVLSEDIATGHITQSGEWTKVYEGVFELKVIAATEPQSSGDIKLSANG